MQASDSSTPPVLVLGLGNILLGDDGVGPTLLREVQGLYAGVKEVECIDGGTQGLALLGYLTGRKAIVILDALAVGKGPGEVSVLEGASVLNCCAPRSTTAHEGNAGELLAAAQLLGDLPERILLVGVEPECLRTELGLSQKVAKSLPKAFAQTCEIVERILLELKGPVVA